MRALALLGLLGGLALGTLLVLSEGAGAIWHGMAALGWGGFAAIVGFHLGLIGLMGLAWRLLGRGQGGWLRFAWGRLIRDSGSEALPLSQIGGLCWARGLWRWRACPPPSPPGQRWWT